jgi:hypothetical protein
MLDKVADGTTVELVRDMKPRAVLVTVTLAALTGLVGGLVLAGPVGIGRGGPGTAEASDKVAGEVVSVIAPAHASMLTENGDSGDEVGLGWDDGRVVLVAGEGLNSVPMTKSAPGYVLTATMDNEQIFDRLERELGLRGGVENLDGDRTVRRYDEGATLWIDGDLRGSFGAYLPARSPLDCRFGGDCKNSGTFRTPGETDARAAATRLLDAFAGSKSFVTTTEAENTANNVRVLADLRAGDVVLPLRWTIDVSSAGIYSINGFTAQLRKTADYGLVDPTEAAARTAEALWSTLGPVPLWQPVSNIDESVPADLESWFGRPVKPSPVSLDAKVPPKIAAPLREVEVNDARLSLSLFRLDGGQLALLPVWAFETVSGSPGWAALAVTAEHVILGD